MSLNLPDQRERDTIAGLHDGLEKNLLVEAAAGTGKTTCMIARMVALLQTGRAQPSEVVAVTFTRKAASELQSRFLAGLQNARVNASSDADRRRLEHAIDHVEQTFIGTIHSFCARLLRERPVEAGVDVGFTELDEYSDMEIRHEAWDTFVHELLAGDDELLASLNQYDLDLAALRHVFIEFAEYPDVASWPTDDVHLDDEVLELAAGRLHELRARIDAVNGLDELARREDKLAEVYVQVRRRLRYLDTSVPAQLMQVLALCRPRRKHKKTFWPDGKRVADDESAWYEQFVTDVAEPMLRMWHALRYQVVIRTMKRAVDTFDEIRAHRGVLSFEDLLMKATRLLRDQPHVRASFARRFKCLLVDEFQDTDPIQAEMMLLLTADRVDETDWTKTRPRPGSLFVVGDPKQSIYRFRRADIVTYAQVRDRIVDTGGAVVSLVTNFRARPELVDWTNDVFQDLFPKEASDYSPTYDAMAAGRAPIEPADGALPPVAVLQLADVGDKVKTAQHEAQQVAWTIASWIHQKRTVVDRQTGERRPVEAGDFLILARQKANFDTYARAIQRLGIACETSGGEAIRNAPEVTMLRDAIRAATRSDDTSALVAALRGPLFGISDVALYEYTQAGGRFSIYADADHEAAQSHPDIAEAIQCLRSIAEWVRTLPPTAALLRTMDRLRLIILAGIHPDGNERAGTLIRAVELIRSIATSTATGQAATMADLMQALDYLMGSKQIADGMPAIPTQGDAVRIMSVHVAKGLEAPVVFLLDPRSHRPTPTIHIDRSGATAHGYMAMLGPWRLRGARPIIACPLNWARYEEEAGLFETWEETRLRYVAATRAISTLIVSRRGNHRQKASFWQPFDDDLETMERLPQLKDAGDPAASIVEVDATTLPITGETVNAVRTDATRARRERAQPSYDVVAIKESVITSAAAARRVSTSTPLETTLEDDDLPRGAAWGELIHLLLEAAMTDHQNLDLRPLAQASLEDAGIDPMLAPRVVDIVNRVKASKIWTRAQAASRVLVEVPFQRHLPDRDLQTLERGVIDLAFRDLYGWTIVDYKTDRVAPDNVEPWLERYRPQIVAYADAFAALSGEPVVEAGLYFVRLNRYVTIDLTG